MTFYFIYVSFILLFLVSLWGSEMARLRNQCEFLLIENDMLRDEVDAIGRLNAANELLMEIMHLLSQFYLRMMQYS